jgi:ribosomal 50S subunit-recycling heat shock protein
LPNVAGEIHGRSQRPAPEFTQPEGTYRAGQMDRVRVDKWLWAARFFKTRSAASEAVLGGRVHVNGVRVKPAKEVTLGDMLELTLPIRRATATRRLARTARCS